MLTNFEIQNLVETLAIMDQSDLSRLAMILKTKYPNTAESLDFSLYVAEMESVSVEHGELA